MGSNKYKEKFNREKCRQEIARQYNDEINTLKKRIEKLSKEIKDSREVIEHQQKTINEQEEKINLYKMVVNIPESDIVKLVNEANTKHEFLEAMSSINKILGFYK